MKDLVFVDVETTGLDPDRHELIEVAAVRVHPHTLEPLDHLSVRVVPERLEREAGVGRRRGRARH